MPESLDDDVPALDRRDTELIIVRHGRTEGNVRRLLVGRTDMPLDDLGRQQAEATADFAERSYSPDAVVASPLIRARETARAIADRLALPLEIEPELVEIDFGDVEGWAIEEALTHHPRMAEVLLAEDPNGYAWPNGETLGEFHARVWRCFTELGRRFDGRHAIVVTHGGVLGSYTAQVAGRNPHDYAAFHFDNCGVTRSRVVDGRHELLEVNLTAHLPVVDDEGDGVEEIELELEAAS